MIIRKATLKDSKSIAKLLLLAMEDVIHAFIAEKNNEKAEKFLLYFIEQKNNQYSYENCLVAEEKNEIIAAVNLYNGADLKPLREPVIQYVQNHYNTDFTPEDETHPGEYYIDSLGVSPGHQGRGTGSGILKFLIDKYVIQNKQNLGLLVDEKNPDAEKLYLRLGFKFINNKTLAGKKFKHLQITA